MINVATFGTEIWSQNYFPEAGENVSFRKVVFISVQPKIMFCSYWPPARNKVLLSAWASALANRSLEDGGAGLPVRATVGTAAPASLSRVLRATGAQRGAAARAAAGGSPANPAEKPRGRKSNTEYSTHWQERATKHANKHISILNRWDFLLCKHRLHIWGKHNSSVQSYFSIINE